MSQTGAEATSSRSSKIVPPRATIPIPRTGGTAHVDTECTLGEYYVLAWLSGREPIELSADEAEDCARSLCASAETVRRLNGR